MITVKMVRDKGFEFVEGDWLLPQDVHGKPRSIEVDSLIARWVKKHTHWSGIEVKKFTWRDNKGEMPCDGDLLVEVETAEGGLWHVAANVINWPLNLGKWNVVKWRPSLKNWESEMNLDKIETQEEREAFECMAQDNEKLQNHEIGKDLEVLSGSEWHGVGLPPVGVECEYFHEARGLWVKFVPLLITDNESSPNKIPAIYGEWYHPNDCMWEPDLIDFIDKPRFRKPETPEQKAERERYESAVELREVFGNAKNSQQGWLEIVDKTGYRKQNG